MLTICERRQEIASDLAHLLHPGIGPRLIGCWPHREGVAWTWGHNVPDRAAEALAVLNATAAGAAARKRQAGIRGRGLKWPFWHYSLSWHVRDRAGRDEMLRGVRETLRLLELLQRQAFVVGHRGPPRHAHVLACRSSPVDGQSVSESAAVRLLDFEADEEDFDRPWYTARSQPVYEYYRNRAHSWRRLQERAAPWRWRLVPGEGWRRQYLEPLSPCPDDDAGALLRAQFRADLEALLGVAAGQRAQSLMRRGVAGWAAS